MSFDFNSRIYREAGAEKQKMFSILLPTDTRAKLQKIKPQDISLGEAIRQILDNYLNIERPLRESHIDIAPTETFFKARSKKKEKIIDEFDFL